MSKQWTPNTEPDKLLNFVNSHEKWIEDAYTKPPEGPEDYQKPLLIIHVKGRLMPIEKLSELIQIADSLERFKVDINVNWNNYKPV